MLVIFFVVAHFSIPKKKKIFKLNSNIDVRDDLQNSGKKMVLTTFSSALISELDIVLIRFILFWICFRCFSLV